MTTKRTAAAAATEDSVIADDGVKFICDVRNVEDLLLVPNTKWVIGSGFNWEPEWQNYLHLFNAENETGAAYLTTLIDNAASIGTTPIVSTTEGAPTFWQNMKRQSARSATNAE